MLHRLNVFTNIGNQPVTNIVVTNQSRERVSGDNLYVKHNQLYRFEFNNTGQVSSKQILDRPGSLVHSRRFCELPEK